MEWIFEDKPFTQDMVGDSVGFVYEITCLPTGRKYLGKKLFTRAKTRQVKKKKKRFRVESDWANYYGSNEKLLNDVKNLGKEHFHRQILRVCKSKAEASYFEAKYQFDRDALLSETYYNQWLYVRVRKFRINA
jgi:hypothetical protein